MSSSNPASVSVRRIVLSILCVLLACAIVSPALADLPAGVTTIPVSTDPLAQDNPELISCLKTHVAYVSQTQDARMEGVISYIDTISNGQGSGNLRDIREDYLTVASSIPLMQTADDID